MIAHGESVGSDEGEFHDDWAAAVDVQRIDVEREFSGAADPENQAALSFLQPLADKHILDAGCGYGVASVYFALRGARVTALDVSSVMLERTRQLAERYGVTSSIETLESPLEAVGARGNLYDAVYGYGVLHHTDLGRALAAVRGALKTGGVAVFVEPLGLNPLVNLYRRLSPGVRTKGECPFGLRELARVRWTFPRAVHVEVQLTSMVVYALLAVFGGLDLNRDRLWKVLSAPKRERLARILARLSDLDRRLIRSVPPLGLLSWATVIAVRKGPPITADTSGR